jgi:serine/threonine protein kinase
MDRIIALDHFSEKVHALVLDRERTSEACLFYCFGLFQDTAAVTADVLNAIQYLHDVGITHRDLKVRFDPLRGSCPFMSTNSIHDGLGGQPLEIF